MEQRERLRRPAVRGTHHSAGRLSIGENVSEALRRRLVGQRVGEHPVQRHLQSAAPKRRAKALVSLPAADAVGVRARIGDAAVPEGDDVARQHIQGSALIENGGWDAQVGYVAKHEEQGR